MGEHGSLERKRVWTELCSICTKTIIAAQPTLEAEYELFLTRDLTCGHMGCRSFEILGIDVMLNSQRKPYLIEVNHLPSFGCSCPVDVDVKKRVISQALDLTCDDLPAMDAEMYEKAAKKRPTSLRLVTYPLLDCTEYKDYLRIFPPTEKCPPILAAEYLSIIRILAGIFNPASSKSSRWSTTACTPVETTNSQTTNSQPSKKMEERIDSPGLRRSVRMMTSRPSVASAIRARSEPGA